MRVKFFVAFPSAARRAIIGALVLGALTTSRDALGADDFTTRVIRGTFKIIDPKSTATAFVISRPRIAEQGKSVGADPNSGSQKSVGQKSDSSKPTELILVTAAHVFELTDAPDVTLQLRVKKGENDYQKLSFTLPVRSAGKTLWYKHASADVAAIRISPPKEADIPRLSLDLLADDAAYKQYELRPGDRVSSCGYPHQIEANAAGFPLLRVGAIATFPLLPAKTVKSYFAELNTFEGDSGSPVFLDESNREYGGKTQPGRVQLIVGMVIAQEFFDEEVKMHYGTIKTRQRLGLAVVVPAEFIRETVNRVPAGR